MQQIVGIASVALTGLGRGRLVIQNLGPGDVYLDSEPTVTTTSGLKLAVGDTYEFSSSGGYETGVSLISTQANTDVRVVTMGV